MSIPPPSRARMYIALVATRNSLSLSSSPFCHLPCTLLKSVLKFATKNSDSLEERKKKEKEKEKGNQLFAKCKFQNPDISNFILAKSF